MSRDDILLEAEMSMDKSVDYLVHEFSGVRTGKASPALVENVDVQAYGSAMKLKQLALITSDQGRERTYNAAYLLAHVNGECSIDQQILLDRIRKGLKYVSAERLVAAPDCGMKYMPRAVAFGKLKAMADAAAMVRREIG